MFGLIWAKALTGFVVPAVTAGILSAVGQVGIDGKMTINTLITSFVTGICVYLVPNAKK